MSVNRKLSSTRPIRQSAAPAARHSRKFPHRPAPEGHRMHGAVPQLSSAAASAAVDHDGESFSLCGIRTDHAQIKWRQTFDFAPCPPRKPLLTKASGFR